MKQTQHDEINFFEIFEWLWTSRWKIIGATLVAALVGVTSIFFQPKSYIASTPILKGTGSTFLPFLSLNRILKANQSPIIINQAAIFDLFVIEFNDYEEMVSVLEKDDFVNHSIKGLDKREKNKRLVQLAKSFKLNPPSNQRDYWLLTFEWHNFDQGSRLADDAISKVLANVQTAIADDLLEMSLKMSDLLANKLENEKFRLELIERKFGLEVKKRLQYLTEQSAIAKELGLESNRIDVDDLTESPQYNIPMDGSSFDVPFYLRGYKAIDKEIAIINDQSSHRDRLLLAKGYIDTLIKIFELENDRKISQLKKASNLLTEDDPHDWVLYDLSLADIETANRPALYISLCMVLGGIFGAFYVIITEVYRRRK